MGLRSQGGRERAHLGASVAAGRARAVGVLRQSSGSSSSASQQHYSQDHKDGEQRDDAGAAPHALQQQRAVGVA